MRHSIVTATRLAAATALVVLAGTASAMPAGVRATPAELPKGFGTALIDGVAAPGEWDGAASQDVALQRAASEGGGVLPARLSVMNDENNIYIGLRVARATVASSTVVYWFSDIPSNSVDNVLLNPDFGFFDEYGGRFDTELGGSNDGAGRAIASGDGAFYEISHPLDSADDVHDISVLPAETVSFSLFFRYIDLCSEFPRCFGDTTVNGLKLFVLRRSVTLIPPELEVRWKRSVASGRFRLLGYSREPAQLALTASGPTRLIITFSLTAGDLDADVPVPRDFLPGTYKLALVSTANGVQSSAGQFELTADGPVEGVVKRSWLSATRNGRPIVAAAPETSEIWAHFRFSYRARERVTVSWYDPRGGRVARAVKPSSVTVETVYRSPRPLRRGVWRVSISAQGRVADEAKFRVR